MRRFGVRTFVPRWNRWPVGVRQPLREAFVALPFGLFLGLAVAAAVVVGANVANATPSEERPFGWPGPANYDAGVATERPALVLAATLPGLLMGLVANRPSGDARPTYAFLRRAGIHATTLWAGAWLGAWLVTFGVSRTSDGAVATCATAHALLACAWYGVAVFARTALGTLAAPVTGALGFLSLQTYESWVRWQVFRQVGYHGIMNNALPAWFYAAQLASPMAAYRGVLILGHRGFRNWEERAVLDGAVLPPWLNPAVCGLVLALWFLLFVQLAALRVAWLESAGRRAAVRVRRWRRPAPSALPVPTTRPPRL